MEHTPQKPPRPESVRDPAPAGGLLHAFLAKLTAMRTGTRERKSRLNALLKDIELEKTHRKQRLEQAKGKLTAPMPPDLLGGEPAAGKNAGRFSRAQFSWAARAVVIALALSLLFFGLAAIRDHHGKGAAEARPQRETAAPAGLPVISGTAAARRPAPPARLPENTARAAARREPAAALPETPGKTAAARPPAAVPEERKGPATLALSAAHPVGLAFYDGRWLSVDWMDGQIFELDPADGLKLPGTFPNSLTTGLSAGRNCLWSTDAFRHRFYKHDPKTFSVLESFATPGPSPGAIYWDGGALWLTDKKKGLVYKYPDGRPDAAPPAEYQLLETEPVGLWRTGDLLWVLDQAGKTIRRYRVGNGLLPMDTLDISGWLPEKARPVGLAVSGPDIWLLTENPSFLYKRGQNQLKWVKTP